LRRHIATASCACVLLFAEIVVPATQTPPGAQLMGEAPARAVPLSLWYRAPASDHPFDTTRASGAGAAAEWVRALPVGNGRLGAMLFGGVVHEQLQLNEDTLWPLRLRRGERERAVARTSPGAELVFLGEDLRPAAR
jgi:alpha-L-fucosidase 2